MSTRGQDGADDDAGDDERVGLALKAAPARYASLPVVKIAAVGRRRRQKLSELLQLSTMARRRRDVLFFVMPTQSP